MDFAMDEANEIMSQTNLSVDTNYSNRKSDKINRKYENEIKSLHEKLAQSNARLYEYKNSSICLRQEVNKAQRIICSEIGKDATIASLSSNYQLGKWKGRSQQIQELRQKIIDLKMSRLSASPVSSEQKNLGNVEKEKRQQIENLSHELKQSEIVVDKYKKKFQAVRARIKVLENDLCLTRSNLILINEKKIHDEQLINALNGQLRAVESRYRDKEIELRNERDKIQKNCYDLERELAAVKFQVEQLRKRISEREIEIDTLRSTNKSEQVCRPASSTISIQDNSVHATVSASTGDPNEYVILGLAAEAERERLLELVAVVNQRLDKERSDTDHVSGLLRREKNKNTKLEKKLHQMEMKQMKGSRINSAYQNKVSKSLNVISSASKGQLNPEEIHDKLELLEEEYLALKTRLITVQKEKESDLIIYKHMLNDTRKIFQDACRNNKPMVHGYSTVTI